MDGVCGLLSPCRCSVRSAPELEQRFNTPGGNVYHVSATAMRFGPLRPPGRSIRSYGFLPPSAQ